MFPIPDQDNIARKLDVTTAAMQTKGTVSLSVSHFNNCLSSPDQGMGHDKR